MADFSKELTSAGNQWTNLLAIAQANGYTGGSRTTFLTLEELGGNAHRVKLGHSSGTVAPVSGTDGEPLSGYAKTYRHIDLAVAWYFTPGAQNFNMAFHSDIDF